MGAKQDTLPETLSVRAVQMLRRGHRQPHRQAEEEITALLEQNRDFR
jgi:hypothetical protein